MQLSVHVPPIPRRKATEKAIFNELKRAFNLKIRNRNHVETIVAHMKKSGGEFQWHLGLHYDDIHLHVHRRGYDSVEAGREAIKSLKRLYLRYCHRFHTHAHLCRNSA